ncbi:MAG TPA: hydrogenase subunit MbhD domain-containing protein [Kofleriaceae bacterium]
MATAFDGLLACALPFVAWRALATDDLPRSVVFFIALGLLSALAWARLDAPDVALVEASVGAGLTGALLVSTLRWIGPGRRTQPAGARRAVLGLGVVGVAVAIEAAILALPDSDAGLAGRVAARLPESGVGNPVTAVLLNFRGYDTLLEVAVLVEAIAAIAVSPPGRGARPAGGEQIGSLLAVLVRMLGPGVIVVAGYLLWRGADGPGGAFQAAAVLTGGGILMVLGGVVRSPDVSSPLVRAGLVVGPGVFVIVAATPLVFGHLLLEYPPGAAGWLISAIEVGLTWSIALVLLLFFPRAGDPSGSRTTRADRT